MPRRPLLVGMALILVLGLGNLGCELDTEKPPVRDEQTVQLTHLGSIGNSLTAGFMGGGLEKAGQFSSFPNHLSQVITNRAAQMPLIDSPGLGSESGMTPLFVDESGDITRDPLPTQNPLDLALNISYPLPYDNLGVPGATTHQILTTHLADEVGNPFFDLILRNKADGSGLPSGGTAMEELERIRPDFITAWSGNNEILGGALSGSPQSDDPQAPGYIVPVGDFEPDFIEMCDCIEALEPLAVAIANIPPITAIPYTRFFSTGSNPFNRWVMEEDINSTSHADSVELVLLTAPISECIQCFLISCQFDPGTPCDTIPPYATLTFAEVELINNTIDDYNAFIAAEVTGRGWAFVDVNAGFLTLPNNPNVDELNVAFPWQVDPIAGTGEQNMYSAFTLDGVHPSEKGNAQVANWFLEALNGVYGTSYPLIDVDAIQNVSGFERAPSAKKMEAGFRFTRDGLDGLKSVIEMMSAR